MRTVPPFDHLIRLTTPLGLYEHALGTTPRIEHGYCVDDAARALVVTSRVPAPDAVVRDLTAAYLDFVLSALRPDGHLHNRRRLDGTWSDRPSSDDHWGRALWAMGTAAAASDDPQVSSRARAGAGIALRSRSAWPRSMAYASLGAGQLLQGAPDDVASRRLLEDARRLLRRPLPDRTWPWPEDRLTYANAVLPEAMIVIGGALEDPIILDDGLLLLGWLLDEQQREGHLSVVPSTGWSRAERQRGRGQDRAIAPPGYAQQPIEVAVLAEACRTAYLATGDGRWAQAIDQCHAWFEGANDGGVPMHDPVTGGGLDGLERRGPSVNQGAESTLAWLSTFQVAMTMQPAVSR